MSSSKPFQTLHLPPLEVVKALYHEGGSCKQMCRGCGDKPKRYYHCKLTNGSHAALCRDCFEEAGGTSDVPDSDDERVDSCEDY